MKAKGGQGKRQRHRGLGMGLVLLCFTIDENSINNSNSKSLRVSGAGLWDTGQPIRYDPLPPGHELMTPPQAFSSLPHTKAPRELVLCRQCPRLMTSSGTTDDAEVLGPYKVQPGQGQEAVGQLRCTVFP